MYWWLGPTVFREPRNLPFAKEFQHYRGIWEMTRDISTIVGMMSDDWLISDSRVSSQFWKENDFLFYVANIT